MIIFDGSYEQVKRTQLFWWIYLLIKKGVTSNA